jgi:competence transcription factor ComK
MEKNSERMKDIKRISLGSFVNNVTPTVIIYSQNSSQMQKIKNRNREILYGRALVIKKSQMLT